METLLAVFDLDSVVLDPRGAISELDREALVHARSMGIHAAFASARRCAHAGATLRNLALDGWVIGSDGAQIGRARDDRLLSRNTLPATVAARMYEMFTEAGLTVFALSNDGVHGELEQEALARLALPLAADGYTGG